MGIPTKLRLIGYLDRIFPIRALKWKSKVIYRAFDAELAKAKIDGNRDDLESLEQQRHWEISEYEDKILAIRSRKLTADANDLYVYIPDLQWETGNYGDRYLDKASASRLYLAVKEQKDKIREYRLKLAGACTGIIGALIGLIAIWKK